MTSIPGLTCAPSCISGVSFELDWDNINDCIRPDRDIGLCGLVTGLNIASSPGYDQWECDADGYTTTDPCDDSNPWIGVECTLMNSITSVVAIDLSNIMVFGK